jgi:hypothetical protein
MPHGEHNEPQTAFRLPADLRDWLRTQAAAETRTMTAILVRALETERARLQKEQK